MSKPKPCYLVMLLTMEAETNIGQLIKLEWATGMIGALPVFGTKKAALKYAGKGNKHLVLDVAVGVKEGK